MEVHLNGDAFGRMTEALRRKLLKGKGTSRLVGCGMCYSEKKKNQKGKETKKRGQMVRRMEHPQKYSFSSHGHLEHSSK